MTCLFGLQRQNPVHGERKIDQRLTADRKTMHTSKLSCVHKKVMLWHKTIFLCYNIITFVHKWERKIALFGTSGSVTGKCHIIIRLWVTKKGKFSLTIVLRWKILALGYSSWWQLLYDSWFSRHRCSYPNGAVQPFRQPSRKGTWPICVYLQLLNIRHGLVLKQRFPVVES